MLSCYLPMHLALPRVKINLQSPHTRRVRWLTDASGYTGEGVVSDAGSTGLQPARNTQPQPPQTHLSAST